MARRWEAQQVVGRVSELKESDPGASVAILVQSRSHLTDLIPALRRARIHWHATDIDRMGSLPVIDDLQSLTRALLNLGDRIAWLAILRAPWCGLALADLYVLSSQQPGSIWLTLENHQHLTQLSDDGRARLDHFVRIMAYGLRHRFRCDLRRLVESVWTLLDGAALAGSEIEQASVAHYFDLLDRHQVGGSLRDYREFARQVGETFLPSTGGDAEGGAVSILTMHKAKGLEFDHVILPALGGAPRADDKPLLQWHERVNHQGEPRLFIAALSATGRDDDPLYGLLRHEQSLKSAYEKVRLLYIAVTRARKTAHLSATLSRNTSGEAQPPRGSLLSYIWPQLQQINDQPFDPAALEQILSEQGPAESTLPHARADQATTPVRRFAQPIRLTGKTLALVTEAEKDTREAGEAVPLQEDRATRHEPEATIGTLIHQALETAIQEPSVFHNEVRLQSIRQFWRMQLAGLISDRNTLESAVRRIESDLRKCLESPETAWLFDPELAESATELPVSRFVSGQHYQYVVDLTFVDKNGNRWVVDYKTAEPGAAGGDEAFITHQLQLHRPQLANYRALFEAMESRPVRAALLFTALPRLVELTWRTSEFRCFPGCGVVRVAWLRRPVVLLAVGFCRRPGACAGRRAGLVKYLGCPTMLCGT